MVDMNAILVARRVGEIRLSLVRECSGDISRAMSKFGLTPDASLLVEQDREQAIEILAALLWKDQAYGHECMPEAAARSLAVQIISAYGDASSRYFSNRDASTTTAQSWSAMTESTFDSGIVVASEGGKYFCVWFEDED
ncbi:hypothetical protein [Ralstonia pseudosolanacearum]|nr:MULTISPECIES: hypothetical protein [Ralstonia]APF85341.1 hypothetical protein BCR16_00285 [Ralstonia solanacearum FJAT-1458]ARS57716.1 hypothetical protein BC427_17235 [Ralstonia solanacearum FJAT-91]AXV67900.1 hypothetical protein CJO74_00520 [Ralstonia solanacearum]AXV94173.1 hypothetical protein CJO80_00350 [Ralstonia solanacearum]AXV99354.1 hypothetical protein CJO81_00355 [Ralstonia solanacearum]